MCHEREGKEKMRLPITMAPVLVNSPLLLYICIDSKTKGLLSKGLS